MVIPFIVYVVLFVLVIFFYVRHERLKDEVKYYRRLKKRCDSLHVKYFDLRYFLIENRLLKKFQDYEIIRKKQREADHENNEKGWEILEVKHVS